MNAISQVPRGIKIYPDMEQGSDEWLAARCGLLTASEMKLIVNIPKEETRVKKNGEPYKQREPSAADNEKTRAHLYELLAQRITRYVEPQYIGDDMLRGKEDELFARALYAEKYAPVEEVGFITNNKWGFTLGYSPDGLVGQEGAIECKSRRQRFQIETIAEHVCEGTIPADYMIQVQTGLLVSERRWIDFISYSGGLSMATIRVFPIAEVQDAIIQAASDFEMKLAAKLDRYREALASKARLVPTERRIEVEMFA